MTRYIRNFFTPVTDVQVTDEANDGQFPVRLVMRWGDGREHFRFVNFRPDAAKALGHALLALASRTHRTCSFCGRSDGEVDGYLATVGGSVRICNHCASDASEEIRLACGEVEAS